MAVTARIWAPALILLWCFLHTDCHVTRFGKRADSLFFPPLSLSEKMGHYVHVIEERSEDDVEQILHRFARSADTTTPSPLSDSTSPAALNDSHTTLIVHWAGENSDVIIALAKNGANGTKVFVSRDYGKTFSDISSKLKFGTRLAEISHYYNTPAHNSHYVFTDIKNNCIFVTRDYAQTFSTYCHLPFKPRTISINGVNPNIILGMDEESVEKELFVSDDYAFSWRKIHDNVKSFYWGVSPYENTSAIYVEAERGVSSGNIVYMSQDLFRHPWRKRTIISGVKDFEVRGRYLFATKRPHLLGSTHDHTQLWVSLDRGRFQMAQFPTPENKEFYVADASEDQVMVCVHHNTNRTTNLYISEVEGLRFSLSLERIVYYNPKGANNDTWLRYYSNETFADIHRVEGMRGIFIASQLMGNTLDIDNQRSLITFDKGGEWQLINAPADGDKSDNCSAKVTPWSSKQVTNCSLHLTQQLHRFYPASRASPIMSRKSAPGIILASGVIGRNIKMDPNVFVSADAGVSWTQVLHGEYLYTFADHGGILMAAKQYEVTDTIFYSLDEGAHWIAKKVSNRKIRIYGILTEPGEATGIFSVFGSYPGHHSWLIIQVNMTRSFPGPCKEDDYKWWYFSLINDTKTCLMGRHTLYQRRIREAMCYNGKNYVRERRSESCPCTRLDYECDFGFFQRNFSYDCIQSAYVDAGRLHQVPSPCPPRTYYPYTRGYRKVAGDTCTGGEEHRFTPLMYSCPIAERPEFVVYSSRTKIGRINLDNNHHEDLVTEGLEAVTAVEFDYSRDCLFWADVDQDKINRLCLGGHGSNVDAIIHNGLRTVESLALDWTANTLYWVDSGTKGIYVANTDGHFRRTLFQGDALFDRPRGLALDPHYGYLYWTDWSLTRPRISRAWMDGTASSVEIIVNMTHVKWPNGLAIDLPSEKLYWTDAGLHKIMASDLDGRNIHRIIEGSYNVPHPYAIGVYKNNIYWTDWSKSAVMTASKVSGFGVTSVISQSNIVDMKVVSHTSQNGKSACTLNSCRQLCLPRPPPADHMSNHNRTCKCGDNNRHSLLPSGDEQCLCEVGEKIVNGTCRENGTSTCAADRFQCDNNRCIPATWRCDNDNDCGDHSDELDCPYNTCPATSFTCNNERCIPERWKCDHDNDCGDSSDEHDCDYPTCSAAQFKCDNGRCITASWKCDGDNDCHDSSDERGCNRTESCNSWETACDDGQCISTDNVCNTRPDCRDHSDELHCTNVTCSPWNHACATGSQCIFRTWVCDGEADCHDGSDEVNCTVSTTPAVTTARPICHMWQYRCDNGLCVWHASRCDGYNDCGDNSDERDCGVIATTTVTPPPQPTCSSNEWMCLNGRQCIRSNKKCDGFNNCWDGSDEDDCTNPCAEDHFLCYLESERHCIWDSWVCDGEPDCENQEDEAHCNDTTTAPCNSRQFRCMHSDGCIPLRDVCNGRKECPDGSDEYGCPPVSTTTTTTHSPLTCPDHFFMCPEDYKCIMWFHVCDGLADCSSEIDEHLEQCGERRDISSIRGVENSNNISLYWTAPAEKTKGHYSYIVSMVPVADSGKWKNYTVDSLQYTLQHLDPLSQYKVAIYVKDGSHVYPHSRTYYFKTRAEHPDKPTHFSVHLRKGDTLEVVVRWEAPRKNTEQIDEYHVYYQDTTRKGSDPGLVSVRPRINQANYTQILTASKLLKNHHYDIWVTAVSSGGESDTTKKESIIFSNGKRGEIKGINITTTKDHKFRVTWSKVANAVSYTAVMRYSLSEGEDELDVVHTTKGTQELFANICPGVQYSFYVKPIFKTGPGKPSQVQTKSLKGSAVVAPSNVNVTKSDSTTATVSFYGSEVQKSHLIYFFPHVDLDLENFIKKAKKVSVAKGSTTKDITGLQACERYVFRVGATPEGCPLTHSMYIETDPDLKAQPKNVNFSGPFYTKTGITVNLTWDAPCDYEVAKMGYVIEKITKTWDGKQLGSEKLTSGKKTQKIHLTHTLVNLKRNVIYYIRIRTDVPGSRYSSQVVIPMKAYQAVEIVDAVHRGQGQVFLKWRVPEGDKLANDITISFRVDVMKLHNSTYKKTKFTRKTQINIQLERGYIYTFSVTVLRKNKTLGAPSIVDLPVFTIPTESESSESSKLTKANLVAIIVPIGIVIIILAAILTVYVIRHRRLQRSFLAFANSHYDPRSGTTTFTAADDLGDDDDTPLIQGFSDDVPLVIA